MKKYIYIFKATFMENLQYISSMILYFVNFLVMIFVFLNLWEYMYSDSSQIINGYTMKQTIWYVLFAEVLWFGTREISKDIKSGNIAYNINKPYNYIFYIIAKHFGEIFLKTIVFFVLGTIIGIVFIGPIPTFNIIHLPIIIISFILAIFINSLIRMIISIISFWIEDSEPFHWIYDKFILIFGTLFPIEMFPKFIRPIMECTPIFVVNYGPIKLIIDFTIEKCTQIIIAQILYLIIVISLILILYNKGVKKLNVNGG